VGRSHRQAKLALKIKEAGANRAISPYGQFWSPFAAFLTASPDWDFGNRQEAAFCWRGGKIHVAHAAFSADGKILATVGESGLVKSGTATPLRKR